MDEAFYQAFDSIYNFEGAAEPPRFIGFLESEGNFFFGPTNAGHILRGVIDRAVKDIEGARSLTVRPDAKLWLLVNFRSLIAWPMIIARKERRRSIFGQIQEDIYQILFLAKATNKEISAHAVLSTVTQYWDQLQSVSKDW